MGVRVEGADGCVLVPAEDTDRTGLGFPAEGEEYWIEGWLDGVRGEPSLPDSEVELISHLGGITDCLGGRGSRRVSCSVSRSGTKWLSDSITQNTRQALCNKLIQEAVLEKNAILQPSLGMLSIPLYILSNYMTVHRNGLFPVLSRMF